MSKTYTLEIEGAQNGIVYFSVDGREDLGYIYLTGQFCNEAGILAGAKITIEGDNAEAVSQ